MNFKRRIASIILCVTLLMTTFTTSFAQDKISLPSQSDIATLTQLNTLLTAETSEKFEQDLIAMSPDNILLTVAQMGEMIETKGGDMNAFISFVGAYAEKVHPLLTEDDYVTMLSNPEYSDIFKIYLIDAVRTRKNSSKIDSAIKEIAKDNNNSQNLKIYAAFAISDKKTDSANIVANLYDTAQTASDKKLMLGKLNDIDTSKAMPRIKAVFSRAESTDVALATFANKLLIRDLDSFDSAEAKAHLEANKKLITATSNKELIKGCIFALSEFKSADAVKMLFDNVNFEEAKGIQYFARNNFNKVTEYLETADFSELKRIVEAAPIEDFKPILEKQLAAKSAEPAQVEAINSLITLVDTADDESNARYATGYQGYAVYRDGVPGLQWHAGIVWDSLSGNYNVPEELVTVHIPGYRGPSGEQNSGTVELTPWDGFLDGNNNYKGIYGKNTGTRTRQDIMDVADTLMSESIGYGVGKQLEPKSNIGTTIEPWEIEYLRCDGVVEYCYEVRGVRVYGNNSQWDISITRNIYAHALGEINPKEQAGCLTRMDGGR